MASHSMAAQHEPEQLQPTCEGSGPSQRGRYTQHMTRAAGKQLSMLSDALERSRSSAVATGNRGDDAAEQPGCDREDRISANKVEAEQQVAALQGEMAAVDTSSETNSCSGIQVGSTAPHCLPSDTHLFMKAGSDPVHLIDKGTRSSPSLLTKLGSIMA